MSSSVTNLQQRVTELESVVEQYQATEVTHQYDIEKLQRKLLRAETDIDELEKRNKDLLIAERKSVHMISRLTSQLHKSTEELNKLKKKNAIQRKENQKLQEKNLEGLHKMSMIVAHDMKVTKNNAKLKRDIEAKERKWKQQENEFKLQLALKSKAQNHGPLLDFDQSNSSSKRGLNGNGINPPRKKQKILNLSNRTNSSSFPTGCTLGPFGVPTKMELLYHVGRPHLPKNHKAG